MDERRDSASLWVQRGAKYLGVTGLTALGVLGGPTLALPAAVAAAAWPELINDFFQRPLSDRERLRCGAAFAFAIVQIDQRLQTGEAVRQDGFLLVRSSDRSAAEEILEGVLQKSRDEHEERKIRILSNIYANLVFDSSVSEGAANHILVAVSQLTYRQVCILELVSQCERGIRSSLRDASYGDGDSIRLSLDAVSILTEVFDLVQRQLILHPIGGSEWDGDEADCTTILEWPQITPSNLRLTRIGRLFVKLAGSSTAVKTCELDSLEAHLR